MDSRKPEKPLSGRRDSMEIYKIPERGFYIIKNLQKEARIKYYYAFAQQTGQFFLFA